MATIIVSECQAGKTAKVLEVIKDNLEICTLTIVLTQANNKLSVEQFVQRAAAVKASVNIFDTNDALEKPKAAVHTMVVGFHHKKHENKQVAFLGSTRSHWSNVILVIDEADEGGLGGVRNRLKYISRIEAVCGGKLPLRLILITATIANLSKQILKISETTEEFRSGIVRKLLYTPCVECVYAVPPSNYVGYKWFVENTWVPLELPKRTKGLQHDEYIRLVEQCVIDKFKEIEDTYKELSLVSISHKIDDHGRLGIRLLSAGFNVSIPYNAKHQDAIEVYYTSTDTGKTKLWLLPRNRINSLANSGKLMDAGIYSCKDYTHSHLLKAAVGMGIGVEILPSEQAKLKALSELVSKIRPKDFPELPRLALVAGRKAGRGITFQNPGIDFVCTSFCFAHVRDTVQRGAINTQKLGRAFGALEELVKRPGRRPLLIATKELLVDAGANRDVLDVRPDGLFALKDMVPTDVYVSHHIKNKCQIDAKLVDLRGSDDDKVVDGVIDGVCLKKLRNWLNDETLLVGSMIRYLAGIGSAVTFEQFKEGIHYIGTDDGFESNIKNGVGVKSTYGKLWTYRSRKIYLNAKLLPYIIK